MPVLEGVDGILLFFGYSPEFNVIKESTCHIGIESSQLDLEAVVYAVEDVFECSKASMLSIFFQLMSFSVSRRLPRSLHKMFKV